MTNPKEKPEATATETPLEGWKEIAAYLNRTERTVKRWEKEEGLPVHRHQHAARASVYAYPSELDAWKAQRDLPREEPQPMPWRRPVPALALVATLLLALVTVASGPLVHPPGAAAAGGLVARQVWTGPGVDAMGQPSPDGRYLSFVDWSTGNLAIRDLGTGETRPLTGKRSWTDHAGFAEFSVFSPAGDQITYAWYNHETKLYELRRIGLDATGSETVYSSPDLHYVYPGDWAPDGKYIAAVLTGRERTHQLALLPASPGQPRILKSFDWRYPSFPRISPDGRWIAYSWATREEARERDLFLLAIDGSREVQLTDSPSDDFVLGWAPDASSLLFASDRAGSYDAWLLELRDGTAAGEPRRVKSALGDDVWPIGTTRDGTLYYSTGGLLQDVFLAEIDPASGKPLSPPQRLPRRTWGASSGPEWSPDGTELAYRLQTGRGPTVVPRIAIRSMASGEEREFQVRVRYLPTGLRWSADGRYLLFSAQDEQGRQTLFRMDAKSGALHTLARENEVDRFFRFPRWSPDGKAVYYAGMAPDTSTALVRLELETDKRTELFRPPAEKPHVNRSEPSPDGRWIVFGLHPTVNDPSQVLLVIPATGGEPRELFRVKDSEWVRLLAWMPDSRSVLVARGEVIYPAKSMGLWRISVEGGPPQLVDPDVRALFHLRVHPDGKRIAYDTGGFEAEVWALENLLPAVKAEARPE